MSKKKSVCVQCERDSDTVPILKFGFQGKKFGICPEHLPLLIHQPQKLAGKIPGAGEWVEGTPAEE